MADTYLDMVADSLVPVLSGTHSINSETIIFQMAKIQVQFVVRGRFRRHHPLPLSLSLGRKGSVWDRPEGDAPAVSYPIFPQSGALVWVS